MRNGIARFFVLLLAVMPAVWGTCPKWLESESTAADAPACPCCPKAPARSPLTNKDCDGCPILDVRHACAPAPTPVALPAIDVAPLMLPIVDVEASRVAVATVEIALVDPSGGAPPPLVGTVILLI